MTLVHTVLYQSYKATSSIKPHWPRYAYVPKGQLISKRHFEINWPLVYRCRNFSLNFADPVSFFNFKCQTCTYLVYVTHSNGRKIDFWQRHCKSNLFLLCNYKIMNFTGFQHIKAQTNISSLKVKGLFILQISFSKVRST